MTEAELKEIRSRFNAMDAIHTELSEGCEQPDMYEVNDKFHEHAFTDIGALLAHIDALVGEVESWRSGQTVTHKRHALEAECEDFRNRFEYEVSLATQELTAEVERLKDESRIVDSVWKALGIENYEQAKPYSISEHVSRLRDLVREAGEIVDDLTIYGAAATVRNEKAWSKAVVDADVWQKKAQA